MQFGPGETVATITIGLSVVAAVVKIAMEFLKQRGPKDWEEPITELRHIIDEHIKKYELSLLEIQNKLDLRGLDKEKIEELSHRIEQIRMGFSSDIEKLETKIDDIIKIIIERLK